MYQNRWYLAEASSEIVLVVLQRSPCKDTWNLVLVHLRKIPRSAWAKILIFRFNYTPKCMVSSVNFQNFAGEGHTEPLPQTPSPHSISVFAIDSRGRFASSVRAAPLIHPSNMFNIPSPNRGVLDQTLFSQNFNFLATPLDPIFRSNIT